MKVMAKPAITKTGSVAGKPRRRQVRISRDWFLGAVLGILGVITFIPIIMLLQLSLKDIQQIAVSMWLPTAPLHYENYLRALNVVLPYLCNSIVMVVAVVGISIFCSTLSAYVLARYPFPGREFFFAAILALRMVPAVLTLFTTFVITIGLNLNDTNLGLWLPIAAGGQAFQIIVLRAFFASVPQELIDSARMDGAGETRILTGIVLPMSRPILSTMIVIDLLAIWNEYIWPLVVLSKPDRYPIVLHVLRMSFDYYGERDPGGQYAAYVLSALPLFILFAFTSRTFIRGLTSGAVKM